MELIEGFGADGSYLLFVSVRKVESAAGIRSRDLGTPLRALPVLLAIQQLSPRGLHSPWLDAACHYTLSRFGLQLSSPLPSVHSQAAPHCLPSSLRATASCNRTCPTAPGGSCHTCGLSTKVVESYPASRRVVVILSLPRNPCSARRSLDAFLRAPTADTLRESS